MRWSSGLDESASPAGTGLARRLFRCLAARDPGGLAPRPASQRYERDVNLPLARCGRLATTALGAYPRSARGPRDARCRTRWRAKRPRPLPPPPPRHTAPAFDLYNRAAAWSWMWLCASRYTYMSLELHPQDHLVEPLLKRVHLGMGQLRPHYFISLCCACVHSVLLALTYLACTQRTAASVAQRTAGCSGPYCQLLHTSQ